MLNLLLFVPVALLLLAALGIVILQQARPSIGYAWLIAALAGLIASGAMLYLRWRIPLQVVIEWWRPFAELSTPPMLRLDLRSWPYAFSLVLIAAAFVLTDAARLETEARPYNWAGGLALTALGLLAVMAGNPITFVVIWTAVDLVEFLMVMVTTGGRQVGVQTVTLFSVKVAGTLLLILAILLARAQGIPFDLDPIPAGLAVIMLLAAGLRLGVLPLNIPYTREVYRLRGLGNVMRMIGPASSMVVLARMPEQAVPPEVKGLFLFLAALAALYGGAMWLAADNETNGRPYWMIALAALGVASVVNGHPQASAAWGAALLLTGGILFFYSAQRRQILFIPILGVLGITGLPFTPAAAGWTGIADLPSGLVTVPFLLSVLLLVWGYLRFVLLRPREELYRLERWVHTVYPVGLFLLILGQWAIAVFGWPGSLTVGVWWASATMAFLAALGAALLYTLRYRRRAGQPAEVQSPAPGVSGTLVDDLLPLEPEEAADLESQPVPVSVPQPAIPARQNTRPVDRNWLRNLVLRTGAALAAFFRLDWLYQFISWVYQVVQNLVQLFTLMFEGDGGILWSLVMLALLISLIWVGGVR